MPENKQFPPTEPTGPCLQCPPNSPHRILVVDQDPYVRHLSADVLIRHGYEVNAAEDGAAGWKELQAYNYHLLITEHDLPKLTGIELVRKLRATHMALPVVMATGRLPVRALAQNPSLQFAATLLKPLPVDTLLDTVKTILRAPQSPREQHVPPARSPSPLFAVGWQPKLSAAVASTSALLQEINKGYRAFAYWGLNE